MSNAVDTTAVRALLEAERARITTSLEHLAGEQDGGATEQLERAGVEQDIGDRRMVLSQLDESARLAATEEHLVVSIDEALARLDEGKYGVCESCEAQIPAERLEALPWAVRCTECEGKRSA